MHSLETYRKLNEAATQRAKSHPAEQKPTTAEPKPGAVPRQ